jgi:hypothetical protein
MTDLVSDLEFCRACANDFLIISKGNWNEHLQDLDVVSNRLQSAGLKVNANKSFFGIPELEYCGYWNTRKGIQPATKK